MGKSRIMANSIDISRLEIEDVDLKELRELFFGAMDADNKIQGGGFCGSSCNGSSGVYCGFDCRVK